MRTVSYALGVPLPAASRGGDCRAYDVAQGRYVLGLHHFASAGDCLITNGMLRLRVVGGAAPAFTFDAYRGRVTIGDYYSDTYSDTYPGSTTSPLWSAMGTLTLDSPDVLAVLTTVGIVRINSEAVTLRMVAPLMADAFVTLRRGEPFVRIQHGDTRANPLVEIDRRVSIADSPSPTGVAATGRVEETSPVIDGCLRWVAAIDPVTANAGAFTVTAEVATTARFGAGVGTYGLRNQPADHHSQLGDASRPVLVVA